MRRTQSARPLQAMLLVVVVGHTVISSRLKAFGVEQLLSVFITWTMRVVAKQGEPKVTCTILERFCMMNGCTVHAGLGTPPSVEPVMVTSSLQMPFT